MLQRQPIMGITLISLTKECSHNAVLQIVINMQIGAKHLV